MRRCGFILALLVLTSVSVRAQGPAGAGAGPGSGSHTRTSLISDEEFAPWQIAIGYQYNRDNLLGTPFSTNGLNVSVTRYFGRWLGAEAQVGAGFGNTKQTSTPPNLTAKSVFTGAGLRLAWRSRRRIEPWGHGLVGLDHYRFNQTAGPLGSNNAIGGIVGGGVDVYLNPRTAVRVGGDAVFSRFFSLNQRSFQAVCGLVLHF